MSACLAWSSNAILGAALHHPPSSYHRTVLQTTTPCDNDAQVRLLALLLILRGRIGKCLDVNEGMSGSAFKMYSQVERTESSDTHSQVLSHPSVHVHTPAKSCPPIGPRPVLFNRIDRKLVCLAMSGANGRTQSGPKALSLKSTATRPGFDPWRRASVKAPTQ